jgi:protease I
MRRDPHLVRLVRDANEKGLPMGIICHGGSVAITAGIVRGKRVTGSLGIKDDLVNAGGIWVDEPAFRDANQVWGRVVADIPAFTRELVALCVQAAGA